MTEPDRNAVLEAAQRLEGSMVTLGGEIAGLRAYGERNRHLIWALAASLVLDLVLSVAVGFLAVQATNTSKRADEATSAAARNLQTQIATCRAGNEARAANRTLWEYLISVALAGPQQAAQAQFIEQFRTYIGGVFAARNCDNPGSSLPTPTPPPLPSRPR